MEKAFDFRAQIRSTVKRCHLLGIPACFLADAMVGYRTYRRIVRKYGIAKKRLYFVEYRGTGDTYIACSILDDAGAIDQNSVFIAPSSAAIRTAALFPFGHMEQISLKQAFAMREMMRFYGEGTVLQPVLYESEPMIYSGIFRFMEGYGGLDFFCMMRAGLEANAGIPFRDGTGDIVKQRTRPVSENRIRQIFADHALTEGRTALLAPYIGGHGLHVPQALFFYIAQALSKKGYTVCTNSSDAAEEPPVPGTEAICLDFCELVPFLERAGTFIGARSGLCDIIAQADCRKVVLYDESEFYGVSTWREFFSLKRLTTGGSVKEYTWPGDRDQLMALVEKM